MINKNRYLLSLSLSLSLSLLSLSSAFILPQFVRDWHPIGIENNIDKSKPYVYNIGKLPMVLWYDNNKKPISTLNICKHLGAKLDNGIINNGCLQCINHLTNYNETDAIGTVVSRNGLLWWSYKSYVKQPTAIFKETYKIYHNYIDVNVNLVNVILEFIYSNNNKTKIKHKNKRLFITEQLYNAEHRYYYQYPYYFKGSINKKINYSLNFLPLEENKTRIYINIANNNDIKTFMNYFFNSKLNNLKNYDSNSYLKYLITLKNDNSYMRNIYSLFDKYSFPNEFTVSSFYKYKNFY
jgi:nitrite reductase/ring-hydroxylating ferredoxin subunit